tara:strand:+ start:1160 stop:1837 length:678 start_codon:yes stop_codon:yes gene_type:complete
MQNKEWAEELKRESDRDNYPQWPNEVMLKVIFGSYLEKKFTLQENANVLDIGCFFGNNLFPFAAKGANCYGVDIHEDIVEKADSIFKKKGYVGNFAKGSNSSIPHPDNTFDLLVSVNTIHYQPSRESIINAMEEFKRVLKPGGRFYISTVGSNHDIRKKAIKIEDNLYEINNWDFRDGQKFHFFEDEDDLSKLLNDFFVNVEVGEITEQLMKHTLGFYVATGEKS